MAIQFTSRATRFAAVCAFAIAMAAGCSKPENVTIVVDGSSTVGPISKAVANAFNAQATRGVSVTVAESGTGGGFSKFCEGATQIQDASRPIKASEMEKCAANNIKFIELPIAYDALTVISNPASPVKEMTVAQLKTIWEPAAEGKVTTWKAVDKSFPDKPLHLFGPGTASGTFDYFTAAIVGEEDASRKDYSPSENDNNIILGVAGDEGALGYLGLSYYEANKDKVQAVAIKLDAAAPAVTPSFETVLAGTYVPLSRPLFIYVNADSLASPPVAAFVNFYLANVPNLVGQAGYIALPPNFYSTGQARVANLTVGTAFGGKESIGFTTEQMLSNSLSLTATK